LGAAPQETRAVGVSGTRGELPMIEFRPFGLLHWATLALTVAVTVAIAMAGRRHERWRRWLLWGLGVWLAFSIAGVLFHFYKSGEGFSWSAMPLHLCDIALMLAAGAVATRRQWLYELSYFFGLAGATQAILTPDLSGEIKWWQFATFFGAHASVIAAVIFLTCACGMRPQKYAVWRAMFGLTIYTVCVALVNWATDANFGYLREKPTQSSVLDHLGDWPWYIGGMGVLALASFSALYAPFYFRDRRARERTPHTG
jgi:hypothetical integral membrane protein (TIGR02206 family)